MNQEARKDGRILRGVRSRGAIVDALIELVREGDLAPTAEQVAERASVGTRTVFRHFDDMESLYAEMAARVEQEVRPLLEAPLPEGRLVQRAQEIVRRRAEVFERITPFKRSSSLHRWAHPFLERDHTKAVRTFRSILLSQLPELKSAPDPVLEAVDLLTSFETWDRLRRDQRLGRERAEATVARAVVALLSEL